MKKKSIFGVIGGRRSLVVARSRVRELEREENGKRSEEEGFVGIGDARNVL